MATNDAKVTHMPKTSKSYFAPCHRAAMGEKCFVRGENNNRAAVLLLSVCSGFVQFRKGKALERDNIANSGAS